MDSGDERQRDQLQQRRPPRVPSDMDLPIVSIVERGAVSRVAAADIDALVTAAFEAHRDEIFTFVARTTRDHAEAEDLVQETFLRLAREVRAGRPPEQLRAWLYRVASNLVTSRFRHLTVARNWLERAGARQDEHVAPSPEAGTIRREERGEMERALGTIPRDARTALLLAAQGFSGREIARTLGRSELATRALMCRARVRVRAELESTQP